MRYAFGIVGAGVIASTHAKAISAVPDARLVAVTDEMPASAKSLAREHDCAAEPDLDALLARDDVDVVSICVPSGLHAEVGTRAAAAGKHLVVEKPIEVTLAAADRLIGAAEAAGVAVTVISQHRFDPGLVELRRLIDAGAIGTLLLGESRTKWYRSQSYYDSAAWRGTSALDGGSLLNQGIHYVDLLLWCMGPVAEVTGVCATQTHRMEAEDVALAMLRFRSGAVGTIVTSTSVYPGFAQRLEISGTSGTVVIEDGEIVERSLRAEPPAPGGITPDHGRSSAVSTEDRPRSPDSGPAVAVGAAPGGGGVAADPAAVGMSSHAAQIADLLAAIDEGRPPAVTAADGRAALEVACAVYESARDGRAVVLPESASARASGGTSGSPQ